MINAFFSWFDETPFWHWFAKNILTHLTLRVWGYTKFNFDRVDEIQEILLRAVNDRQHLYAFVATDRKTLASILIRTISVSRWSHAGLIKPADFLTARTMHMKGKGFVYEHIFATLRECDDFAIVKIKVDDYDAALEKVNYYLNNSSDLMYDYEQELEDQASILEKKHIYCSELVWMVAKDHTKLQTSKVLGRVAFSPDDVYRSGEVIFEHSIKQ